MRSGTKKGRIIAAAARPARITSPIVTWTLTMRCRGRGERIAGGGATAAALATAQPGIEEGIDRLHGEIGGDGGGGGEHDERLDDGIVFVLHRLVQQVARAQPLEDDLDEEGAA